MTMILVIVRKYSCIFANTKLSFLIMGKREMQEGKYPASTIDPVDKKILRLIQQDAKLNVKEIAAKIGITKTPVYERVKRMEREGIISGYVALVNAKKITTSLLVFCAVTLDVQKAEYIEQFASEVSKMPEVMECYLTGGVFDFLLKVVVKDLDTYHEFASHRLAALPNVRTIKSSFVLSEYKHSTVFPLEGLA